MSIFILIIFMVIIWTVFGSAKALKDTKNEKPPITGKSNVKSQRNPERQERKERPVELVKLDSNGILGGDNNHVRENTRDRSKGLMSQNNHTEMYNQDNTTKKSSNASSSLLELDQKKMAKAILLSEILDKPRALRPHQTKNKYRQY